MRRAAVCIVGVFFVLTLSGAASASSAGWPLWDQYKTHFLTNDGRIVDWSADECTTSEGEAYALFFALTANDRPSFDLILNWTTVQLAQGSLDQNLPAWLWKRSPAGNWSVADNNSASDADLWIAYTLLQAGRIWRAPSYTSLGRSLAARIAREEVASLPGNRVVLLPGRQGFQAGPQALFANPSYAPLQLLTALAQEFPEGPWRAIANSVLEQLAPSVGHGFAMDWVQYHSDSGFSAWAGPTSMGHPSGGYDAIRVYLWAGMLDQRANARSAVLNSLSGMRAYMVAHDAPPERIAVDGTVIENHAPVGFSAAVIPFLLAAGENAAARTQSDRLKRERVAANGLYGKDQHYYDQNLALFSQGWTDGLFRFDALGQLQVRWKAS